MPDRREPDDHDERDDGPVERPWLGDQAQDCDQPEDEDGSGEDPPRSSDATVRGFRGIGCRPVGFAHVWNRG
jgi:hypothetical protein